MVGFSDRYKQLIQDQPMAQSMLLSLFGIAGISGLDTGGVCDIDTFFFFRSSLMAAANDGGFPACELEVEVRVIGTDQGLTGDCEELPVLIDFLRVQNSWSYSYGS